jgi:hypothetical protein
MTVGFSGQDFFGAAPPSVLVSPCVSRAEAVAIAPRRQSTQILRSIPFPVTSEPLKRSVTIIMHTTNSGATLGATLDPHAVKPQRKMFMRRAERAGQVHPLL